MAIDKIQSESINLADTFAFTGTVTGAGETIKPAFRATMSTNQDLSQVTWTKINFNTETFDTDGNYDHSSNYRFTPTTAGKYFIYTNIQYTSTGLLYEGRSKIYKNGSGTIEGKFYNNNDKRHLGGYAICTILDMNGSSDYVEAYGYGQGDTPRIVAVQSDFGAYKLF